jgi:hypothetical protein
MVSLSLLCSIAANLLVNYAVARMSVFKAASFGAVSTLCTTVGGILFLKEPANWQLLLGAALIFFRRGHKDETPEGEAEKVFTMLCLLLIIFAIVQMLTVLVMSGDSLLVRQSFLMSVFIDILVVLFLSEVLHKLKIIDVDKE